MQSVTPKRRPRILSGRLRLVSGFLLGIIPVLAIAGAIFIIGKTNEETVPLTYFGIRENPLEKGKTVADLNVFTVIKYSGKYAFRSSMGCILRSERPIRSATDNGG
ncbi:MAG: hypothetical protein JRH12_20885 [Deltaproteobacteria bacterium]|jgi:hypothetical protein|nr:hypothetical protein [Deltaproteobacteria bacterium]